MALRDLIFKWAILVFCGTTTVLAQDLGNQPTEIKIGLEKCSIDTANQDYLVRPAFRVTPQQSIYSFISQASPPNTLSLFKYFEEPWGEVTSGTHSLTPMGAGGYRVDFEEIIDSWGLSPWQQSFVGFAIFINNTYAPISESLHCGIIFWEGDTGQPDPLIAQFIHRVEGGRYEYRGPDFRKNGGGGTWVGNGGDNGIQIGSGVDQSMNQELNSTEGISGGCSLGTSNERSGPEASFFILFFILTLIGFRYQRQQACA